MGNTDGKNGRPYYCKDCAGWHKEAEKYKNNAADTRDVTIYCPQGFDAGNKRGWYSSAACMKKTGDMPDIIRKCLEKVVID